METKEIAIKFAEWIACEDYAPTETSPNQYEWWQWENGMVSDLLTTAELYAKFLSTKVDIKT